MRTPVGVRQIGRIADLDARSAGAIPPSPPEFIISKNDNANLYVIIAPTQQFGDEPCYRNNALEQSPQPVLHPF